jgi:hypothetical protein
MAMAGTLSFPAEHDDDFSVRYKKWCPLCRAIDQHIVRQVSIRESHWLRAVMWAGNISISRFRFQHVRHFFSIQCGNEACFLDAIFLVNERWHFSNLSNRLRWTRKWWESNINGTNSWVTLWILSLECDLCVAVFYRWRSSTFPVYFTHKWRKVVS